MLCQWGPLENYTRSVEGLPLVNTPAVFGLHPNAEIGYLSSASKEMWRNLIDLQPRTASSGAGVSREEYIARVVKDIQTKIPQVRDPAAAAMFAAVVVFVCSFADVCCLMWFDVLWCLLFPSAR